MQIGVILYLIMVLYGILKVRYRREVWSALGWSAVQREHIIVAGASGAVLGLGAAFLATALGRPSLSLPAANVVLFLATVGPFLEESLFRGWLLPLLATSTGRLPAVVVAAALFAVAHQYSTGVEFVYATVTGSAYGWMRLASGTTTAAAVMHSVYNVVLWAFHST